MNSFLCLALLFVVASAHPHAKPISSVPTSSWAYPVATGESWKFGSGSYQDGVSYVSPISSGRYVSGHVSGPVSAPVSAPVSVSHHQYHHSAPVVARSGSAEWQYQPVTWSETPVASVPTTYSSAFYSSGFPQSGVAQEEKHIVSKKIVAPIAPSTQTVGYYSAGNGAAWEDKQVVAKKVDQIQPSVEAKLVSYSTEISHDVPAKKEEITVSGAAQTVPVAQPIQYSAWSGESKPATVSWTENKPAQYASWTETKPAHYASWTETKPATYTSEIKPATVSWTENKPAHYAAWTETKPATYTSDVKPATVSWTENKPAHYAAWTETKPAHYASWTETKPATFSWNEPKPATFASWSEAKPAHYSSWTETKPVIGSWTQEVKPVAYGYSAGPSYYGSSWEQPIVSTNAHYGHFASVQPVAWTESFQKRSGVSGKKCPSNLPCNE